MEETLYVVMDPKNHGQIHLFMTYNQATDFCKSSNINLTQVVPLILPSYVHLSCDYCEDDRFIEPAGNIHSNDSDTNDILKQCHEEKKFFRIHYLNGIVDSLEVVDRCPICGHLFTEEDYDRRYGE